MSRQDTSVGQVAEAVQLLADNGYPDAFVDLLYVATDTDSHLEWVERLLARERGLLASLRVLDLGGAESDGVGRLFADLGADVLKIEPPGGSSARDALPRVDGASIAFTVQQRQQAQCGARPGQTPPTARG